MITWQVGKFIFTVQVKYNIELERIELIVVIPDNMYFSIGFGNSMLDCDMIAWHAKGAESTVVDYWSTKRADAPSVDSS